MATKIYPGVYWKFSSGTLYIRNNSATGYTSSNDSTMSSLGEIIDTYDVMPAKWTSSVTKTSVTKVIIENDLHSKTYAAWFDGMTNLTTIEGSTRIKGDQALATFDMFNGCKKLTSLDFSGFGSSPVYVTTFMFNMCNALTSLNLDNFSANNLRTLGGMFGYCYNLTSINLSGFNTSNVTNMNSTFYECRNLASLDLSGFDVSNVTDFKSMFYNCRTLTSLNLSSFNTLKATYMDRMFDGCQALTSLNLSNFYTSNVTNMDRMFYSCRALTTLDLSSFDTSNVGYMSNMFYSCQALTTLDLSNFNTSNVRNMSNMFDYCQALTTLNLSNWSTSNVTNMDSMFADCRALTTLDLSSFDTSKVTNMNHMFYSCRALTTLDLSNFNTSNVTSMVYMFSYCQALTTLNLSNWNTSNVTSMVYMFNACQALTTLNLSSFDTSNVASMSNMFSYCRALTTLDLSSFDTSNVTNMDYMFYCCSMLTADIVINGNPLSYWNMFSETTKPIYLFGTSTMLPQLAATANNGNVIPWSLSDTLKADRDEETPTSAILSVTVSRFRGNNETLSNIKVYKEPSTTPMILTWDDPTFTMDSTVKTFNTTLYNLDENKSYSIRVVVEDEYGTADAKTASIPTVYYTIDFLAGGKEISFGAKASKDLLYSQVTGSTAPTFATDTYYERSVNGSIVSYALLDEEPSDWATTYSDYYTLQHPKGLFNCEMDVDFKGNTNGGIIGEIKMYGGSTTPSGWVFCDGSALSRETYSKLFDVIGTTYGTGNGSTTFNIPDMRARAVIGTNNAALPNGQNASFSERNRNGKGGVETVKLSAAQSGLREHNHTQNSHDHGQDAHHHSFSANFYVRHGKDSGTIWVAAGTNTTITEKAYSSTWAGGGSLTSYSHKPDRVNISGNTGNTTANTQAATATNIKAAAQDATTAHNNMPPFIAVNYMIFTGVFSN